MDRLLFFFDCISKQKKPNFSFANSYSVIYETINSRSIEQIREIIVTKIDDHFAFNIQEIHKSEIFDDIGKILKIYSDFKIFKKRIIHLFKVIERYNDSELSLNKIIDEKFIQHFTLLWSLEQYQEIFLKYFDQFHFKQLNKETDSFKALMMLSELLYFAYEQYTSNENIKTERINLLNNICNICLNSGKSFLETINGTDISEIVDNMIQYIDVEKELLFLLFDECAAIFSLLNIYALFTNSMIQDIENQIQESCKKRESEFIKKYYKLISYIDTFDLSLFKKYYISDLNPALNLEMINSNLDLYSEILNEKKLKRFSEAIHQCIKNESIEIPSIGETISFYNDLYSNLNCVFLTKLYNRQVADHINQDTKKVIRDLILYINKSANSEIKKSEHDEETSIPELDIIKPVLQRIENKSDFELIYSRHVTYRLLPLNPKQIKKERELMEQIKCSSSSFEFKNLDHLLNDATSSLDHHFGPVLITSTSFWPFPPPFPRCKSFQAICNDIKGKYLKIYPNRILSFPFNSWVMTIKDTLNKAGNFNVSFIGNGVQAEILLYFNEHKFIFCNAFEPHISSEQLSSALKSLSSKKYPILLEQLVDENDKNSEKKYILNSKFKPKRPFIKLPIPMMLTQKSSVDQILAKNEAIDACVIKIMKGNRSMKYNDMEVEVIESLRDRYAITHDEIRGRVLNLESREFIEFNENEKNIIYIP